MKKILLISYQFPPFGGVGTFRWAQLCKYLVRLGHEIDVLTVDWKYPAPDNMSDLVKHPNIHIHRLPSGYPHNLKRKNFGSWFLNGIRNKFFIHIVDKYLYKFEEAEKWGKFFIPYAVDLIKRKKIDVLIATGPMYTDNILAAQIKQELPEIKVIQDFRDAWSDNESLLNVINVDKNWTQEREQFSICNSDAVVAVTDSLLDLFRERYSCFGKKFICIHNGYDQDIYNGTYTLNSDIILAYIGMMGSGREECCHALFSALVKAKNSPCKFVFVGDIPKNLKEEFSVLFENGIITLIPSCSHQQARDILYKSTAALHFNARLYPIALSVKLIEYIGAGKPVFSIDYGGEPKQLINENSLGRSINPDTQDIYAELNDFIKNIASYSVSEEIRNRFSYETIARQYHELIETL